MITQLNKLTISKWSENYFKWIEKLCSCISKYPALKRKTKTKQNIPSESFPLNIFITLVK